MSLYKGTNFIAGTPDLSEYAKTGDLLNAIYPVGSTYISTTNSCPLSTLISGSTWTQIASNVVVSVNTSVPIKGTGIALGVTDGTNNLGTRGASDGQLVGDVNSFGASIGASSGGTRAKNATVVGVVTDSSKSGIVGTVTRTNLTLYIFKRTA